VFPGDLDGDIFVIIGQDNAELMPFNFPEAAKYEPAPKTELDRPATISDIADFVVDYIVKVRMNLADLCAAKAHQFLLRMSLAWYEIQ
jgi:hypothetical protein